MQQYIMYRLYIYILHIYSTYTKERVKFVLLYYNKQLVKSK